MRELSPYFISKSNLPPPDAEWHPVFSDDEGEGLIDIAFYWHAIRKRLLLTAALVVVAAAATAIYVLTVPPIYTAETTLLIRSSSPDLYEPETSRSVDKLLPEPNFLRTQCEILESHSLALEVVRRLKLPTDPSFNGVAHSIATSPEEPAVRAYLSQLKVSAIPETSLVRVRFGARTPKLAADIANTHADAYIRQSIQFKSQANREAEGFLQRKLVDLRKRLERSETELNAYRREKGIIPGLMSLDGREALVIDRLSDLSKDLTAAQVARISIESDVDTARKGRYYSLPSVIESSTIQSLKAQLDGLLAQFAGMSDQFKLDYPPLAQLKAKVDKTRQRLNEEIRDKVGAIEAAYSAAVLKEAKLQSEVDSQRSTALSLNDAAVKYAILQREVDTNRQLYNGVLQRVKDAGLAAEAHTSNASVVDRAIPPIAPSSPKKTQAVLLSMILALMGGVGISLLLEYFDDSLETAERVETRLHLPNLGSVPSFSTAQRGSLSKPITIRALPVSSTDGKEVIVPSALNSLIGESYRHLRTAILLSRAESPPRTLLFTSAVRGEGKTVSAINTAIMLSQLGRHVLLIDADLRRSRCHSLLSNTQGIGLTHVLTSSHDVSGAIRATDIDHLYFLSAGTTPPNPTELLASTRMREVLRALEERFEYIVIDAPPVLPVSDALVVSSMIDGVIVVVRAGQTSAKKVKFACGKLRDARAKILGAVLNDVAINSSEYAEYYHYSSMLEDSDNTSVG
jgi:capsular exopolysaccharide synthesis family protein